MNIAKKYINGLLEAYSTNGQEEERKSFSNLINGACQSDLDNLKILYPSDPIRFIFFYLTF